MSEIYRRIIMENTEKINKMGTQKISRLMLAMGIPMIISMALQAVYNIVDSYFVSCMQDSSIANLGDYAVNALTLAFPVQMLTVAVGVGTGVGINALLSRSLGEGDKEKCSVISGNSIFLGICTFAVFLIFGLFGIDAYVGSQTNDPIITDMAVSYLKICTIGSLGVSMYMTFEKLLQATGFTMQTTIAQIVGAVANIILDPIMIFGWCGCPKMGINGAALATVIGQFISFFLDAFFYFKYNSKLFDTSLKYVKPSGNVILQIYKVGIPAIIMQALMSMLTYGINVIFVRVSTDAVTAYGIYYKIQQFIFFAAFGMNNAMIPIIGFNYGMQDKKRVNQSIKYGMLYTVVIMAAGILILQLFAESIIGIFSLSDSTRALAVLAVRIITVGFLFAGANITYQGIFQALGNGVRSLVLSLIRLIIIPLPLAYIITFFDCAPSVIWISFPVGEAAAFVVALVMMFDIRKRKINHIGNVSVLESLH